MKTFLLSMTAIAVVMGGLWFVASQAKEPVMTSFTIDINALTKKAGKMPVTQIENYM